MCRVEWATVSNQTSDNWEIILIRFSATSTTRGLVDLGIGKGHVTSKSALLGLNLLQKPLNSR